MMDTENLRRLAMESNDGVLRGPAMGAADEIDSLTESYAALKAENAWRADIENAPDDREPFFAWRDDCGAMIVRWAAAVEFMTEAEAEENGDGEWEHEDDWFCHASGARVSNDGGFTHWKRIVGPSRAALGEDQ